MGRWDYMDSDDYRLPDGMKRVAYDADREVYTYQDSDGTHWEGAAGARYGKLHKVAPLSKVNFDHTYPREGNVHRKQPQGEGKDGYTTTVPARKEDPLREDNPWHFLEQESEEQSLSGTTVTEPSPWRMFAPFLMLVCLVLLLVFRFLSSSSDTAPDLDPSQHYGATSRPSAGIPCYGEGKAGYRIRKGESCWSIAEDHDMSLDELLATNKGMDCDRLQIGSEICLQSAFD